MKKGLESVKSTLSDVISEIGTLKEKIVSVEGKQETLQLDVATNAECLSALENRLYGIEDALEKQEQFSRRENVILHGVRDDDERGINMRKKVSDIFNVNVTSKYWREEDFLRAHRLGDKKEGRNRPIIVRFIQFFDKLKVLRAKDDLSKSGIRASDDLTQMQRSQLSKLHEQGLRGYFRGGKLIKTGERLPYHPQQNANVNAYSNDRQFLSAVRQLVRQPPPPPPPPPPGGK